MGMATRRRHVVAVFRTERDALAYMDDRLRRIAVFER
jgi:hypothetical protein